MKSNVLYRNKIACEDFDVGISGHPSLFYPQSTQNFWQLGIKLKFFESTTLMTSQ